MKWKVDSSSILLYDYIAYNWIASFRSNHTTIIVPISTVKCFGDGSSSVVYEWTFPVQVCKARVHNPPPPPQDSVPGPL